MPHKKKTTYQVRRESGQKKKKKKSALQTGNTTKTNDDYAPELCDGWTRRLQAATTTVDHTILIRTHDWTQKPCIPQCFTTPCLVLLTVCPRKSWVAKQVNYRTMIYTKYNIYPVYIRALISSSASVALAKKMRYMREYAPENQATNCV